MSQGTFHIKGFKVFVGCICEHTSAYQLPTNACKSQLNTYVLPEE